MGRTSTGRVAAWLGALVGGPDLAPPRARRVGAVVLASALVVLCLGTAVACTRPVLSGPDEAAHLGYVGELLDGDLPTIDTPIGEAGTVPLLDGYQPDPARTDPRLLDERDDVWVANHPPLVYLVAAGPARLAVAAGWEVGPLLALRLANVGGFVLAVVATSAAAGSLRPGRPGEAAASAALVAVTPTLLGTAGYGLTDGIATGLATVLLAAVARAARRPPTRRLLAVVAVAAAACALTRASLVPLVGLAAVAWALAAWWDGSRRLAVGGAAAVVGLPAVAAGWFYLRNVDLYGSPTAASYIQERFLRQSQGSIGEVVLRPRFLVGLWQNLWSGFTNKARVGSGEAFVGTADSRLGSSLWVGGLLVLGAAVGWVRRAVDLGRVAGARPGRSGLLVAGLGTGWVAVAVGGVAWFVTGGGTPHARYLLPALPVIAVALVSGLARAAPRLRLPAVAVAGLGLVDAVLLVRIDVLAGSRPGGAMALPGELGPAAWLLAGAGLVVLAATVVGLWRLGPDAPRPDRTAPEAFSARSSRWARPRLAQNEGSAGR